MFTWRYDFHMSGIIRVLVLFVQCVRKGAANRNLGIAVSHFPVLSQQKKCNTIVLQYTVHCTLYTVYVHYKKVKLWNDHDSPELSWQQQLLIL